MDVTSMLPTLEPQAAKTPPGAGKAAAGKNEGDGGFAGLFAGLTASGLEPGETEQPAAEATATLIPPLLWAFPPFIPAAQTTGPAAPATAAPADGIAPLTLAVNQPAVQKWQPATAVIPPTLAASLQPSAAAAANMTQAPPAAAGSLPQVAALAPMPVLPTATAPKPDTLSASAPPAAPQHTVPAANTAPPTAPAASPGVPVFQAAQPTVTAQNTVTVPASITAPAIAAAAPATPAPLPAPGAPVTKASAAEVQQAPPEKPVAAPVAPLATAPAAGEDAAKADTGDGSPAFSADSAAPQAPPPVAGPEASVAPQTFAAILDQRASARITGSDTPVESAPASPASADPHNVAGQIVDHARLIAKAENSTMVIRLKPEHLGELTLRIAVDNGMVSATFHTASAEVRGALEATLPQLRQDMAGQGLKVDYVGVYASLDHFFANDQRHAPQQPQPQLARRSGEAAFQETAAALTTPVQTVASGGIDYRI